MPQTPRRSILLDEFPPKSFQRRFNYSPTEAILLTILVEFATIRQASRWNKVHDSASFELDPDETTFLAHSPLYDVVADPLPCLESLVPRLVWEQFGHQLNQVMADVL